MQRIYSTRTGLETHEARLFLESRGISAKVFGDNNALEVGFALTPATEPGVFVDEAEAHRAVVLLQEFLARPPVSGPGSKWKCASCAETCEEQFAICWNCESLRTIEESEDVIAESSEVAPVLDATSVCDFETPPVETTAHTTRSKRHLWVELLVVLVVTQHFLLGNWIFSPISKLWSGATFVDESGWTITCESIITGLMLLLIAWTGEPWSRFGIYRVRPLWDLLGGGLLYLVTTRVAAIANRLLLDVCQEWLSPDDIHRLLKDSYEWLAPYGGAEILLALAASICIGFSEEIVFRGYLIPRLEQLLNSTWLSVLLTSLLFAFTHLYLGIVLQQRF